MAQMHAAGATGGRRQYRNVTTHRGEGEERGDEESKHEVRAIEPYFDAIKKNTQFFSNINPDNLLGELEGYFKEKTYKFTIDPKKYKMKVLLEEQEKKSEQQEAGQDEQEGEEEPELPPVEMTINILKADSDKFVVEFNRKSGDQLHFFQEFALLRDNLADLIIPSQ